MKSLFCVLFLSCFSAWAFEWGHQQNGEALKLTLEDLEYSEGMLVSCQLELQSDEKDISKYTLPQLEFEGLSTVSTKIEFRDSRNLVAIYNLEVGPGEQHQLKAQNIQFSNTSQTWAIPQQTLRYISYKLLKPQGLETLPSPMLSPTTKILLALVVFIPLLVVLKRRLRKTH